MYCNIYCLIDFPKLSLIEELRFLLKKKSRRKKDTLVCEECPTRQLLVNKVFKPPLIKFYYFENNLNQKVLTATSGVFYIGMFWAGSPCTISWDSVHWKTICKICRSQIYYSEVYWLESWKSRYRKRSPITVPAIIFFCQDGGITSNWNQRELASQTGLEAGSRNSDIRHPFGRPL